MEKLWIECQKCGSVFWIYADEIATIYPKRSIDYQICSKCEQDLHTRNKWMNEYLLDLRNEFGFYYTTLKFIFYFFLGATFLVCVNKIFQLFAFFFSKFSKERFLDRLNFILKLLIFILVSTFLGWIFMKLFF